MLQENALQSLVSIRKDLHANPEVSGNEIRTQKVIFNYLNALPISEIKAVGETGVLACFQSERNGPSIMIRGDIDALPIQEINTFQYASTVKGVSHKCGHDGHTTILLGLAKLLSERPLPSGKVVLLFQPAEEDGMGAQAVVSDPVFQVHTFDFVFALHNLPGYAMHTVVVKNHEFTANVKSLIIKLHGKTSHAAEPELGWNPSSAISKILLKAEELTFNTPESKDFFLITPVFLNMGELAYGISAGYGEIHFTIRSWSTKLIDEKCDALLQYVQEVCGLDKLKPDISWTQVFQANVNDPVAVNYVRKAASLLNLDLHERGYPFKWGEDFGLFTQRFPGAMFGIGAGEDTPALHNPDYDFPDEILANSVHMFYNIIHQIV
jgi:amidohydrolase